eukprot:Skav201482  [mRNA]  locus=scaffold828:180302:186204:- [translate_table: standard]
MGSKGQLAETFAELQKAQRRGDHEDQETFGWNPGEIKRRLAAIAPHLFQGYQQQDVQDTHPEPSDLSRISEPLPPRTEADEEADEKSCLGRSEEFATRLRGDLIGKGTVAVREVQGTEQAKVDAKKKIDLWQLPPVLVIHLKRFEFDAPSGYFRKINTPLACDLTTDLSSFCSSKQQEGALYSVACVANHSGAYSMGHYTATCRVGDKWYRFNDPWRLFGAEFAHLLPSRHPANAMEIARTHSLKRLLARPLLRP